MNRLKLWSMTAVMTLILAVTTFAGEIHTGVVTPPPPPPDSAATAESETLTSPVDTDTSWSPSDVRTEIVLTLLQVLSVY
ncbi:MAG TPA: hypothetical protein VJ875_19385 [Pyrinomonadaceae bacterium]|nr:hypothetical protein [Pyrinomonadaceae bacterium]